MLQMTRRLVQSLYKKNVAITAKPPSESTNWLMTLLVNGVPLIAIIGVWIFFSRRMQGGAGNGHDPSVYRITRARPLFE